jgi:RNA polymerase sigma-70 factor (sigma-E family)
MKATTQVGFEDFVRAQASALFRSAYLLVGNRQEAEDLLQEALERTYRRWERTSIDHPTAYVRRTMANLATNRRRRRQPLTVALTTDHDTAAADETENVHQRTALLRALDRLPPRQRVVLVLRYWEDMTERETASSIGCSVGSVKRHAARGLERLRQVMAATGGPPLLPPAPKRRTIPHAPPIVTTTNPRRT